MWDIVTRTLPWVINAKIEVFQNNICLNAMAHLNNWIKN